MVYVQYLTIIQNKKKSNTKRLKTMSYSTNKIISLSITSVLF